MTNRNYRRIKKYRKLGIKFISLGIVLCAIVFLIERKIDPIIFGICDYNCAIIANKFIGDSIDYEINQIGKYKDFVEVTTDSEGKVRSIQMNASDANRFVINIGNNIDRFIEEAGALSYEIRLGSLTGISYFYDKGFPITVGVTPKGYVQTTLISSFTSAGINQTMHQTILHVELYMTSQLPISEKLTVSDSDVIISQTVIVGEVPNIDRNYYNEKQVIASATTNVEG